MTPSLFTLERARSRAEIFGKKTLGDTHTLENPYEPGHKYMPAEKQQVVGRAEHSVGFNFYYKQR